MKKNAAFAEHYTAFAAKWRTNMKDVYNLISILVKYKAPSQDWISAANSETTLMKDLLEYFETIGISLPSKDKQNVIVLLNNIIYDFKKFIADAALKRLKESE